MAPTEACFRVSAVPHNAAHKRNLRSNGRGHFPIGRAPRARRPRSGFSTAPRAVLSDGNQDRVLLPIDYAKVSTMFWLVVQRVMQRLHCYGARRHAAQGPCPCMSTGNTAFGPTRLLALHASSPLGYESVIFMPSCPPASSACVMGAIAMPGPRVSLHGRPPLPPPPSPTPYVPGSSWGWETGSCAASPTSSAPTTPWPRRSWRPATPRSPVWAATSCCTRRGRACGARAAACVPSRPTSP